MFPLLRLLRAGQPQLPEHDCAECLPCFRIERFHRFHLSQGISGIGPLFGRNPAWKLREHLGIIFGQRARIPLGRGAS
jgi:hypothetical protein